MVHPKNMLKIKRGDPDLVSTLRKGSVKNSHNLEYHTSFKYLSYYNNILYFYLSYFFT